MSEKIRTARLNGDDEGNHDNDEEDNDDDGYFDGGYRSFHNDKERPELLRNGPPSKQVAWGRWRWRGPRRAAIAG